MLSGERIRLGDRYYLTGAGNSDGLKIYNAMDALSRLRNRFGSMSSEMNVLGSIGFDTEVNNDLDLITTSGEKVTVSRSEIKGMLRQGKFEELNNKYDGFMELSLSLMMEDNALYGSNVRGVIENEKAEDLQNRTDITNILSTLGIRVMGMSEYMDKYKMRNGVEPSARALSDMANGVIALAEGATVEDLNEEVAHFLIDTYRNQQEIDEVLDSVVGTPLWNQFAGRYYEVYGKEYQGEELDRMVKREILGKTLAQRFVPGMEQAVEKGKTAVSTAVKGLANAAKGNAHVLVIVGVFLLLILMVMSGFSSCGILFSGGTQVSGQTMYSAEDRDIRGAEQDYKKLEKELDKKIKRTPTDHPGYNEYQYHLDPIEHDPWQLTSFLTTLYDDYTRSEVQGKLKETFKKQYKLTTWVEVQTRYMTVWVMTPAGIPVPTQVPYEYRIFHTKLVNKGLEVVIREELDADQWKRYEIFQDTLGGRPYLFNGGLPPGGSDGSGTPGIDYQIPAEALTDSEFAAIYKEAQKYVGTPYVWGGSTPETGFDCSGYVCWVYNQNGYNVGRTTANGLWNKSQHISEAEAKPGDLVFFEGTYDTPGKSHVGIYLGNGMMVSAGDPIKYANIHSSYWQKYLSGFGRLSK